MILVTGNWVEDSVVPVDLPPGSRGSWCRRARNLSDLSEDC